MKTESTLALESCRSPGSCCLLLKDFPPHIFMYVGRDMPHILRICFVTPLHIDSVFDLLLHQEVLILSKDCIT